MSKNPHYIGTVRFKLFLIVFDFRPTYANVKKYMKMSRLLRSPKLNTRIYAEISNGQTDR